LLRFFLSSIVWTVFIATVSLVPSSSFESRHFNVEGLDKLIHVLLYLFFALFWTTGLKRQYKSKMIRKYAFHFSILGGFLFGLMLEILQAFFVQTRYFDWLDLIANGIGCIFGVLVFKLIYKTTYR